LVKPDVAAPGGTFQPAYGNRIVSADSNDVDSAYSGFVDQNKNDYRQMAGTSMAAPHVAGLAALMIEALGNWDWTLEEALKVKMMIGMTSFETQNGEGTNVPILDRGGKDSKEGYGRVSAEAAIEAVTMNYSIGESAVDAFGAAPMDKKVWARRVWLSADMTYEFNLSVPSGADYDLYLYDCSPDAYGQPVILEKSVNASLGGQEAFRYTPDSSDTYYMVVKWVGGTGAFNLTSIIVEHDVAVVKVEPSTAKAYEGELINISVTVKNEGTVKETFNVTAYCNETILGTARVTSLALGANTTLTFVWNTSNASFGYYVISAMAESVPNEKDLSDNYVTDGVVRVKILGDVDGDGDVDIDDLILVTWALGTDPSWTHGVGWDMWNPECDFNNDDKVDVFDLYIACRYYGMTES
ncbi:MAG: S8 family serine peptidase, partial [Desulfobacterales bacterium]|nr:S8 family serine peptidase [Desulfobacterales bacterium]